jgi:hypothetical protein
MKVWKVLQLIGVLLLLVGVVVRVGGEFYGMWMVVIGLVLYAIGRIGAWMKSPNP